MKKKWNYKAILRSFQYKVRDFLKYRVFASSKHALFVGGTDDYIATQLLKSLKPTWKITTIDYKFNAEAHKSLQLGQNSDLDAEYNDIYKDIKSLNVKFDSIFCFSDSEIPSLKLSDPDILNSLHNYSKTSINILLLGSKLATQFIQNNGLLVLTGGQKPFSSQTPNNIIDSVLQTEAHFLALNLFHRNEEEIPVDATITTFLRGEVENEKQQKIDDYVIKLLKNFSDGKSRPHDGSYFQIKSKDGQVFPEYV